MVELIWDGKYDEDGKRVAPLRVALPFQTVETVNESAQQRQRALDLFMRGGDPDWRNRLIWGDKKYVLPSLLPEFAGKVDLIYIDPPFATGQDFSFQAQVGDDKFTKEASAIEQKAYRDTWGKGLDGYLQWFCDTVVFFRELLSDTGSLYVHIDSNVSHYVKAILDSLFGNDNFRNELIWQRTNAHHLGSKQWPAIHEVILLYSAGDTWCWHETYVDFDPGKARQNFPHQDERGRYGARDLTGGKAGGDQAYQPWRGRKPSAGRAWALPKIGRFPEWVRELLPAEADWRKLSIHEKLEKLDCIRLIHWPKKSDGIPTLKYYLDDRPGNLVADTWTDIPAVAPNARERLQYPTQKPESLLERIIRASSNEGDLVLDCFCGSGTTPAVAEKLKRRWIACDLGRFAIHTSRKRLLGIENVRPFVVQNLGKYERQVWQKAEFGNEAAAQLRAYRHFILQLYHAEPIDGFQWLHGRKGKRLAHVGSVDSPIAEDDVRQIALEFRRAAGASGAGVDVLGWDFALDMNETAGQIAAQAGVDLRFLRIPREVLEPKAVEQGDIRFFELAALDVAWTVHNRELSIELTDFMAPPDDVPADVRAVVHSWEDWIDYWAVDFDYRDDAFHNQWQSYRTRKDRTLLLRANHSYKQPGEYVVLVKAIDILGNDTTKTITVRVE